MLDAGDVREHGDKMSDRSAVVFDGADTLPLRVDFSVLAPIPDLATPLPGGENGLVHALVEIRTVTAG
nr:hypothetical protein [Tanacetum cinerariifolium]